MLTKYNQSKYIYINLYIIKYILIYLKYIFTFDLLFRQPIKCYIKFKTVFSLFVQIYRGLKCLLPQRLGLINAVRHGSGLSFGK